MYVAKLARSGVLNLMDTPITGRCTRESDPLGQQLQAPPVPGLPHADLPET